MGRHTYYPPIPKAYRRRPSWAQWLIDGLLAAFMAIGFAAFLVFWLSQ